MTMPSERARAVRYAREFLRSLLDKKLTPRVPREIRKQAHRILRHFPWELDMRKAAKAAPDVFEEDEKKDCL
jgi:hypothetical protein